MISHAFHHIKLFMTSHESSKFFCFTWTFTKYERTWSGLMRWPSENLKCSSSVEAVACSWSWKCWVSLPLISRLHCPRAPPTLVHNISGGAWCHPSPPTPCPPCPQHLWWCLMPPISSSSLSIFFSTISCVPCAILLASYVCFCLLFLLFWHKLCDGWWRYSLLHACAFLCLFVQQYSLIWGFGKNYNYYMCHDQPRIFCFFFCTQSIAFLFSCLNPGGGSAFFTLLNPLFVGVLFSICFDVLVSYKKLHCLDLERKVFKNFSEIILNLLLSLTL